MKQYQEIGHSWKDEKYKEIGTIVESCTQAFKNSGKELKECYELLVKLHKIVTDYENA